MEKFSVKKPFTILVMVIIIIALGVVSVTRLSTDLLPNMSLPYLMVITPYPGASPEKVEASVCIPMENELGTISGVENIYSISNDNVAIVQMEFEDDTDMDSAMVKVSSALDQMRDSLPDECGTSSILEISIDMVATQYVAIANDNYDIYELTDYVNNEVIPFVSRQSGVASVTTVGLVEKTVQIDLNREKIDELNDKILEETNSSLADAKKQLDDAKQQVTDAQNVLSSQESVFGSTLSSGIFSAIDAGVAQLTPSIKKGAAGVIAQLSVLENNISGLTPAQDNALEQAIAALKAAEDQLGTASETAGKLRGIAEASQKTVEDLQAAAASAEDASEELSAKLQEAIDKTAADMQAAEDAEAAEAAAREAVEAARKAVSEAASAAQGTADTVLSDLQSLRAQLQTLISQMNTDAAAVDGSSFSTLMSTATALAGDLAQAEVLLQSIEAVDPAGLLASQIANVRSTISSLSDNIDQVPALLDGLQTTFGALTQAQLDAAVGFSTASGQLADAQLQLESASAQYESSREAALANANLDSLLSVSTLSSLIYAQNFSMPAGYIDDKEDNSWLLKIGSAYESSDEIASALLVDVDPIGTVRLQDVADITVIDNAEESYAKLNGSDSIILCIYKASTAGTNEVSRVVDRAMRELEAETEGTHTVTLVDQGDYISMIIESVLSSMLLGAALAILVLALFLKSVRPTLVVAVSIPLSVLLTIVLMYFTDLSLNIMTLSGLALGIGMLVDNSIVVMENIFRLRTSGLPAPRAAVQGAKQVRGSIVASTLTTVCVFLPAVFASGTVRDLLYPLALSVGYCLMSSLLMALTVVPAACSTLLKNAKPKKQTFFDHVQNLYGKSLYWCLKFKFVPLTIAIALLAVTVYTVIKIGIVYLPDMTSNEIQVSVSTPEGMTREESYAATDKVLNEILAVDGIEDVGIMDAGSTAGLISSMGGGTGGGYGNYICFVTAPENASKDVIDRICADITAISDTTGCKVTASAGSMGELNAMGTGSGLSINVYGSQLDKLEEFSTEVADIVSGIEGFENVSTGVGEGEATLHLVIDKDKAMSYGLTVAQIYAEIAQRISTSVTSTTVTVDGVDMTVVVRDITDPLVRENLLDMEFDSSSSSSGMSAMGGMSGMSGMSGMGGMSGMSGMSAMSGSASAGDMSGMMSMMGGSSGGIMDALTGGSSDEDGEADENSEEKEEESTIHKLRDFATLEETVSMSSISRENQTRYLTVTASTKEGYNTTLLSRELIPLLDAYEKGLPTGYSLDMGGETSQVAEMLRQMLEMIALALLFIYMIMVAQFQSLLSPFIVLFTVPLAFTGGMLGLMAAGQQLSLLSMMGFLILMGTIVNNGIVFVDYANQLRIGGLKRHDALVATGKTRMRPILMTALTTILAMGQLIFGKGMASQLGSGMAIVISGGLAYGTLMTLYIIPIVYDIFFKRRPLSVDVGSDLDEVPDDAAEYLAQLQAEKAAEEEKTARRKAARDRLGKKDSE